MSSSSLAKLSRPRTARAVARERLFERFDAAREQHQAVFVVAPPGAGKTTAVASWLNARRIPGIWFQVDAGDAELPAFFSYLRRGAQSYLRKGQRSLPLLTPEYLGDVPGFSRRFFRGLFAQLPRGAVLVLDNYQEVSDTAPLHELIAAAVAEVPPESALILVSRSSPPACFARVLANDNTTTFHWDDLRLSLAEALAIGQLRVAVERTAIERLHAQSEGWAAGFVLLLERLRRGAKDQIDDPRRSPPEVFDYFAGQLFALLSAEQRSMLMRLSYLPRMTESMAQSLSASVEIKSLLDTLHCRHLFTDRREMGEPVWQFHALFRAFLQAQAVQHLDAAEQKALILRAAAALRRSNQPEDAFPLFVQIGELAAARAMVLEAAPPCWRKAAGRVCSTGSRSCTKRVSRTIAGSCTGAPTRAWRLLPRTRVRCSKRATPRQEKPATRYASCLLWPASCRPTCSCTRTFVRSIGGSAYCSKGLASRLSSRAPTQN